MWNNKSFPAIKQLEQMDCGPTCLQIIAKYYGVDYSLEHLRNLCDTNKVGSNMLSIYEAAKMLQLKPTGIKIGVNDIDDDLLPCIAYWNQNHFVVIYKVEKGKFFISDPAIGLITYTKEEFLSYWSTDGANGILLILETTDAFFAQQQEAKKSINTATTQTIKKIVQTHQKQFIYSLLALLLAASMQFAFPIITQQLVDKGISQKSVSTIWLLLAAQFAFFLGKITAEIVNTFILLRVGNAININLVYHFFDKLFRLPLSYFNVKRSGDILQRINDHNRVQIFITNQMVNIFITITTLIIFSIILISYQPFIFVIFIIFTVAYMFWFQKFMKQRALLDYKNFSKLSERQDKNLELIMGMPEIKLNNAVTQKKEEWKKLQKEIFALNEESLKLSQKQFSGANIINEVKNILITFLAAYLVVNNQISFGEMLAITYIVGQLNMPIQQILVFIQQLQDAQLSFQRIQEVHQIDDEDKHVNMELSIKPDNIILDTVSFSFSKHHLDKRTLKHLGLTIEKEKMTAIVGPSGCGKSTLMKLLIQYYNYTSGSIKIGSQELKKMSGKEWRTHFSVVMQENYIFNDTILNNICLSDEELIISRLEEVIQIVELEETLKKFPMSLHTKIGSNGMQISGGEKQRILLARALYKNAHYLFLDEATSNLDAISEANIMRNIQHFYKNKTIVVIAHRLSSVKNADKIVVMERGYIMEIGNHESLLKREGIYTSLIKEQIAE